MLLVDHLSWTSAVELRNEKKEVGDEKSKPED